MFSRVMTAALVAATGAFAFASPAAAQEDLSCALNQVPEQVSRSVLDSYPTRGADALDLIPETVFEQVAQACVETEDPEWKSKAARLGESVVYHYLRVGARNALLSRHALDEAAIERAWRTLSEDQRAVFAADNPSENQLNQALLDFLTAIDPSSAPKFRHLIESGDENAEEFLLVSDGIHYALGRAHLEALGYGETTATAKTASADRATERAVVAGPVGSPVGRYLCQSFEAGMLQNQGEFALHADGTYRDFWNEETGRWTYSPGTSTLRFTGGLDYPGATARFTLNDQGTPSVVFSWGNEVERWCYVTKG